MSRRLLSLAAPRVHHEALDWARRVAANGGSCSQRTLRAVSTFCVAVERAGIRDRFYRLNLFCGNSDGSLVAVRTPLFRGPSFTGTQYGNATDTAINFVPGDYAETGSTGGLTGLTNKYLQTGLQTSAWITGGNVRSHLAVYKRTNTAIASSGVMISSRPNSPVRSWELGAGGHPVGENHAPQPLPTPNDSFTGVTRQTDTEVIGFRNSTFNSAVTYSATVNSSLTPFTIFCRNGPATDGNTYSPAIYSNQTLAAYSIGSGMTQAQIVAYNAIMQAFQAALSRNV